MLKSWAGLRAMCHAAECHNPWQYPNCVCSLGPSLACDAQPGHLHEHPHGEIGFTLLLLGLLHATPLQRWISRFVCLGIWR